MNAPQDPVTHGENGAEECSTVRPMTDEAREKLVAAARRYNAALTCGYPGCRRRPRPRTGSGHSPRYCALPEHNPQTAFAARGGKPDPIHELRADRDRVIREVYASGGASYREIASIAPLGLRYVRVRQICALTCPVCGETLTCAHRLTTDPDVPRWTCPNGHDAAEPAAIVPTGSLERAMRSGVVSPS